MLEKLCVCRKERNLTQVFFWGGGSIDKIQLKRIKFLNVRPETVELLGKTSEKSCKDL